MEGARDRAMLLLSTQTAFRGDNLRGILLSDLGNRDVPIVDLGPGRNIWVRVLIYCCFDDIFSLTYAL